MNPLWTRIHRFIWSTMIQMISDHWSWSGSYQRNAPQDSLWFLIPFHRFWIWVLDSSLFHWNLNTPICSNLCKNSPCQTESKGVLKLTKQACIFSLWPCTHLSIRVRKVRTWSVVRFFGKKPIWDLWSTLSETACPSSLWFKIETTWNTNSAVIRRVVSCTRFKYWSYNTIATNIWYSP